jgi:hypothetical protein
MQSKATTVLEYLTELSEDRQIPMEKLHKVIKKNLPKGFEVGMNYGMIGYYIPHKIYPAGYHCDPKAPLPFMALASQKNFIAVYHMGVYAENDLGKWFAEEYNKLAIGKLDMGKSCIRFKKMASIPYDLIGELASKMTPQDWIVKYEKAFKK